MDVLTDSVLPGDLGAQDWATDVYLDWGEGGIPTLPGVQWRLMRCLNGRVLLVPAPYAAAACPGDQARAQVYASVPPRTMAPALATSAVPARRDPRRPRPAPGGAGAA